MLRNLGSYILFSLYAHQYQTNKFSFLYLVYNKRITILFVLKTYLTFLLCKSKSLILFRICTLRNNIIKISQVYS